MEGTGGAWASSTPSRRRTPAAWAGRGFRHSAVVFEETGPRALPRAGPARPLMAIRALRGHGGVPEEVLSGRAPLCGGIRRKPTLPYDIDGVVTPGRESRGGLGPVGGANSVVYGAGVADRLLVAGPWREDGPGLFDVAASDAAYRRLWHDLMAARRGEVTAGTARPRRASMPDPQDMLDWAVSLALSAEALGAMDATFAMLTEYLGTRRQFGQPIGAFQAASAPCPSTCRSRSSRRGPYTIAAAAAMGGPGSVAPRQPGQASGGPHRKGRGGGSDPDALAGSR